MSRNVTKRASVATLAVPLAMSALLAGCGGSGKPVAASSSTAGSSPTSTAGPTTSTSPTSPATSATGPNIPAAARAHTPAGAAAFVKYFHQQLNLAWGQPRAGLLAPLSLPSCKTCRTLEDTASNMLPKHQRMLGDTVRIDSVDAGGTELNGDQTVVVRGAQLKTSVVDSSGKRIRKIPAGKLRLLATTRWTADGWRVSEIKVLK